MRKTQRPSQKTDEIPEQLPGEVGGYALSQTPNGIQLRLTTATIGLVVGYRLLVFSLAYAIAITFFRMPEFSGLMLLAVLLSTIPVLTIVLAPIRLGFAITRDEVVINRFIVCYVHRMRLPVTAIKHFSSESFRGHRSFLTAVTFSFHTPEQSIKAAKFYTSSEREASHNAELIERVVSGFLVKSGATLAETKPANKDYTWHIGLALFAVCIVCVVVRVYSSVFGEQDQTLQELEMAGYLCQYGAWVGLAALAVAALIKVNKGQILGMVIFASFGYLTHGYERLVLPASTAIKRWALSDTEVVEAEVKQHAYDAKRIKAYEPRGFFFEYRYGKKKYRQFLQPEYEVFQREKSRRFRVGAKVKFLVSKRFPSLNRIKS